MQAVEAAGVTFLGPTPEAMEAMSSKTAARTLAQGLNVPTVPGTPDAIKHMDEAKEFCKRVGFPVILKASFGGGGRGMRVVWDEADLPQSFERATSEALSAFGDGSVFIEKYLNNPRHVEVQIIGDGAGALLFLSSFFPLLFCSKSPSCLAPPSFSTGGVVHLYERDCSVYRRHQKVV